MSEIAGPTAGGLEVAVQEQGLPARAEQLVEHLLRDVHVGENHPVAGVGEALARKLISITLCSGSSPSMRAAPSPAQARSAAISAAPPDSLAGKLEHGVAVGPGAPDAQ